MNKLPFGILSLLAIFPLHLSAAERIELHAQDVPQLTVTVVKNHESKEVILDQAPSFTVSKKLDRLLLQIPIGKVGESSGATIEVAVRSRENRLNLNTKKLYLKFNTETVIRCDADKSSFSKSVQSVTIKPTDYSISSVNTNDLKMMWQNAATALTYKITTSNQFNKALKSCGLHLNHQTLKDDLHTLTRMTNTP